MRARCAGPFFCRDLGHIVAHGACESRAALREVCAQFGFVDARGSAQLTGCLTALKVLESAGQLTLPAPRPHPQRPSPRCLDAPVPAPVDVPAQVRDVEGLRLVVVEDDMRPSLALRHEMFPASSKWAAEHAPVTPLPDNGIALARCAGLGACAAERFCRTLVGSPIQNPTQVSPILASLSHIWTRIRCLCGVLSHENFLRRRLLGLPCPHK